jgi:hypothetical protein
MQDLADPCSQYFVEAYMNQPQVQKTIHANTELKYPWTRCRYLWCQAHASTLLLSHL